MTLKTNACPPLTAFDLQNKRLPIFDCFWPVKQTSAHLWPACDPQNKCLPSSDLLVTIKTNLCPPLKTCDSQNKRLSTSDCLWLSKQTPAHFWLLVTLKTYVCPPLTCLWPSKQTSTHLWNLVTLKTNACPPVNDCDSQNKRSLLWLLLTLEMNVKCKQLTRYQGFQLVLQNFNSFYKKNLFTRKFYIYVVRNYWMKNLLF